MRIHDFVFVVTIFFLQSMDRPYLLPLDMTMDGIIIFIIFEKESRLFSIFCYPVYLMMDKTQNTKQKPSIPRVDVKPEQSRSYAQNPSKHSPIV